jgi:hypothetical protein
VITVAYEGMLHPVTVVINDRYAPFCNTLLGFRVNFLKLRHIADNLGISLTALD